MNYPFRDAILGFLLGGDPRNFAETVESICENYPPQCLRLLMNHIGTPRHRAGLDHPGRGACRQPGPGVAGGSTPVTGASGRRD